MCDVLLPRLCFCVPEGQCKDAAGRYAIHALPLVWDCFFVQRQVSEVLLSGMRQDGRQQEVGCKSSCNLCQNQAIATAGQLHDMRAWLCIALSVGEILLVIMQGKIG